MGKTRNSKKKSNSSSRHSSSRKSSRHRDTDEQFALQHRIDRRRQLDAVRDDVSAARNTLTGLQDRITSDRLNRIAMQFPYIIPPSDENPSRHQAAQGYSHGRPSGYNNGYPSHTYPPGYPPYGYPH